MGILWILWFLLPSEKLTDCPNLVKRNVRNDVVLIGQGCIKKLSKMKLYTEGAKS